MPGTGLSRSLGTRRRKPKLRRGIEANCSLSQRKKKSGPVEGRESTERIFLSAALDPPDPDTVHFGFNHQGILKTVNGGLTWKRVNNNINGRCVNAIAIHLYSAQLQISVHRTGM
jgi:hypothetical protein